MALVKYITVNRHEEPMELIRSGLSVWSELYSVKLGLLAASLQPLGQLGVSNIIYACISVIQFDKIVDKIPN